MEPGMAPQEPVIELGKPKKSKAPIVAVICAILALAGVGFGVFGMMQGMNKDEKKEETSEQKPEEKEEEENYTIYRELVRKYVEWDFSDGKLVEGALSGNISPSYMAYVSTGAADVSGMSWIDTMQVSNLTNAVAQYFEREMELSDELQFRCQTFNKADSVYKSEIGGCGGIGASYPVFDVVDVEEKGESLEIEISYGRIQAGPSGEVVEGSWNGTLFNGEDAIKTAEVASEGSYMSDSNKKDNELTKYFYEHLDEFDHYILTFKKVGKRYLLGSSSKVEE